MTYVDPETVDTGPPLVPKRRVDLSPAVQGALSHRESERHPSSARFHEVLAEVGRMHDAKQLDYGSDADPFANVRSTEELGVPAWVGVVMRLGDKRKRLVKAARDTITNGKPSLANEGVRDTLLDEAVYALIGLVLYEEWEASQ